MPFNPISFLLGRAMLSSRGVDSDRANQLSVIAGFLPPVQGLVIAAVIGQREAPTPIVPQPAIPEKEIPLVIKEDAKKAKEILIDEGFTNINYDPSRCMVYEVSPEEGMRVPLNTQINLKIAPTTNSMAE
jgi:hypothetical protein